MPTRNIRYFHPFAEEFQRKKKRPITDIITNTINYKMNVARGYTDRS